MKLLRESSRVNHRILIDDPGEALCHFKDDVLIDIDSGDEDYILAEIK